MKNSYLYSKEIYQNKIQTDLTHLLYISWAKCLDKDNTNYTVPLLLKWMKTLNHLPFTYNFSFYPPSSQRLLHLLKKDIESTHFLNLRASFHTFGFNRIGTEHIILNHTWYKTCKLPRIAKKNYLIILKTYMFLN